MTETTENLSFDGTKLREARGLKSQSEVAESIGISRQALNQIEKGETKPKADTLVKLCAVLKISISELSKKI